MSWGTIPWGTGVFGFESGDLTVVKALAPNTRTVRVTLSREPLNNSVTGAGDALNPLVWSVIRLDTGFAFTVLEVTVFDPPTIFDVRLLQPLGTVFNLHRVSAPTLRTPGGDLISTPNFADFDGVQAFDASSPDRISAAKNLATRDLDNKPAPALEGTQIGGTLRITAAGDYAEVQGADLVRKLVLRRWTTRPGEFFHLPEYGAGIKIKEALPANSLVLFKEQLRQQALLEPEVEDVSVQLFQTSGLLLVVGKVKLKDTGQMVNVSVPIALQL